MANPGQAGYWQRLRQSPASRRRVLQGAVTFVTGGIVLGLVGCSGGDARQPRPAATQTAPSTGSVLATPAGSASVRTPIRAGNFKAGGVVQGAIRSGSFLFGGDTSLDRLDPVTNALHTVQIASGFHYSRLFRFNAGPDPMTSLSREPVPDLVSGYEVTPDGLTYTLQLRPDAIFHPPLARALTAADVKASWDYFTTSTTNPNSGVYAPIVERLTTPDTHTMVFTLKHPYAPFLNKLANPEYLWIMSQDAASGRIDPQRIISGTGPWIFVGNSPTAWTWKRNPAYFLNGLPYADGVSLKIIDDGPTTEREFAAGNLDVLLKAPVTDIDTMRRAIPGSALIEYASLGLSLLSFSSVQDPASPFKDQRLRRAASVAVDRQALIDGYYNGHAMWENIVPTGLGKWSLDPRSTDQGSSAKWFRQDLKAAKQLIAAAGHSSTEFKFLYTNDIYGDVFNATAEAIARMLVDAGFKISVVTVPYLRDYINNGQGIFFKGAPPNTIVYALETPFFDPDDYLTGMLTRGGNRNHDLVDDPDLEAMVIKQQMELDENKRLQLVYDIQRAHAEKMYYPPVVFARSYTLTQPWVQNFFVADDYNYGTESYACMSVNNR
ncbi:MAG: ABC transporter substrate-binding protein [Dehalococcoidia bacterium]